MEIDINKLFLQAFLESIPNIVRILGPYFLLFVLFVILKIAYRLFQRYKYDRADRYDGPDINDVTDFIEIDKMTGYDFELFLQNLFTKQGYKVTHIGKLGDLGGDLIIEKDGVKTLVQAKRSSYSLREKAVQEAIAAKEYYHCDKAMVVTNNYFYRHAWILGKETKVDMWAREKLANEIIRAKSKPNIAV